MPTSEIETVLANWIEEALSPIGRISDGLSPAKFVARNFVQWWRARIEESLAELGSAMRSARDELDRRGGWQNFGEAMEEIARSQEVLRDLQEIFGLAG